jgi:hypothetical protein
MVSPFVALYRLAGAAAARDWPVIEERVQIKAVRTSLAKQIVAEYLRQHGRAQEPGSFGQTLATGAGASFVDPIIAQLVTPEAVLGLLDARMPASLAGAGSAAPADGRALVRNLRALARTWVRSETRGFFTVLVPFPAERSREEQYKLQLHLAGWTWRVTGIELPQAVLRALVDRLPDPAA